MPNGEKKGITVRIDADLHAEVSQYLRDHSMTMAEFVSLALDDELHPKNQMKEGNTMANTRTIAVQVPEDLFQRIKDYLQRNNMTQPVSYTHLDCNTKRKSIAEVQNGVAEYTDAAVRQQDFLRFTRINREIPSFACRQTALRNQYTQLSAL